MSWAQNLTPLYIPIYSNNLACCYNNTLDLARKLKEKEPQKCESKCSGDLMYTSEMTWQDKTSPAVHPYYMQDLNTSPLHCKLNLQPWIIGSIHTQV